MAADKRFVRYWCEFEVEIVDELTLKAADLDPTVDENGEFVGTMQWDSIESQAGMRLSELMMRGLRNSLDELGIKMITGPAPQPRFRNEDGDWLSMQLIAMPGRNTDGTMRPGPPFDLSE